MSSIKEDQLKLEINKLMVGASIDLAGNVPKIIQHHLPFSTLKEQLSSERGSHEAAIYELLHVLFDTYEDDFSYDLSEDQREEYTHRIRRDRLSQYLAQILTAQAYPLSNVNDAAGAAFQHLTAHNIEAACETLVKAKDYNLALLVAQIDNVDAIFQQDMADQLVAWKDQNTLSEMTEDVRSLYELLSGNTTICLGKQTVVAVVDRATTFMISEKYDLSWLQAFSLCLWYGPAKNSNIEDVIEDFTKKIQGGDELATPLAADGKEDPLWVVLRLYAQTRQLDARRAKAGKEEDKKIAISPADIQSLSKPFEVGSTFNLLQALSRGLEVHQIEIKEDAADQLAADYAFQLEAKGDLVAAVWALAHLSDDHKRGLMIVDLLCRHAAELDGPPTDQNTNSQWDMLTTVLKVPEAWICQAKALYCRSTNARHEELHYLLLAEQWDEAHECLCRRVAPRLVIDEDYETLQGVIAAFGERPEKNVDDWNQGGQAYADILTLLVDSAGPPARKAASARLQTALAAMNSRLSARGSDITAGGLEELEERVAVKEMARTVKDELQAHDVNMKEILQLPLTKEEKGRVGMGMAGEYYRSVMGGAGGGGK
jgi:nuclear pore complex protein Nup98-Nup96